MNLNTVKYTFELIKPNQLIEVRVIGSKTYSGYFKEVDVLISELERFDKENIYFVLNEINEACYSREQKDKFYERPKNTTSDNDIVKRQWLLIDVDTKRATGVCSTDEEKNSSKVVANKVYKYLRDVGFCEPICADSGNGFHLLYKIDLPNNSEAKDLCSNFLKVLDLFFSDNTAEIDKSVFNASRITKLYGTYSRKGKSTNDRPHRESKITKVPNEVKATPRELIQRVADNLPKKETPKFQNNYGRDEFDLDKFISEHNISVTSTQNYGDGTKYILDACVFDESHKGKDACLFRMSSGAIGYKCFHNSCSDKKWQDVRLKFEPTAYDIKFNEPQIRVTEKIKIEPQVEVVEKGKKFQKLTEIKSVDRSKIISIPSGFKELDKRIIGFNKGEVTVWSGKNGSAKSTIINQIMLNGIQKGFKFVLFSGELTGYRIKNWINLQAAGRQFNEETRFDGVYQTPQKYADKINKWLDGKLWVYNNDYGNKFEQLIIDIEEIINQEDIDSIIIDNLMALDIISLDGFKNEKQTVFINKISKFAKDKNVHIHIVAHPRKNVGFLRKDDISGTADLTNAVDNVIICHRNNLDFQKAAQEFFSKEMVYFLSKFSNIIEVCKNRDLGVEDHLVGLYYEKESKRLLNETYDNYVYDWQDEEIQEEIKSQMQPNKEFDEITEEDIELLYNDNEEAPF